MSTLIVMVGLPASGKTTLANKLKDEYNTIALSSDDIREEILNDINDQSNQAKVFEVMNQRAKNYIKNGLNVIYDATNISRKRRIHLINNEIKADKNVVCYLNSSLGRCLSQDGERDRSVGFNVIDKMNHNMEIPTKLEGWDEVIFYNQDRFLEDFYRKRVESIIFTEEPEHDYVFESLGEIITEFQDVYNVPQDSSYHSFSISRHIFYTYQYILRSYKGDRFEEMIYAALFHDLGKGYCKSFYNYKGEEKRYASYLGHENTSAQYAAFWLNQLGYDDEFVKYVVDLVQFHMKPMNPGSKNENKLKGLLTDEQYADLMFLHEADLQAK